MSESAQQTFTEMGHPSRLAIGLLSIVASASEVSDEDPRFLAVMTCGAMGYACRVANPRAVPPETSERIEAALARTPDGEIDWDVLEEDPEHLSQIVGWSSETAADPFALNELSGCSVASWQAFSVMCGYAIQDNVLRKGLPPRLLLSLDDIDDLLRIGYTLRVVDEVAGLEPQHELFS
ncbi:MAG TPA: hypothetical protein VKG38_09990 [Solirubrobacteraceae bacterium]|nr:hypothetical protein [Solirubrobacteraceae bacterium]